MSRITVYRCDWPGCKDIEDIEAVMHYIAAVPLAQIDLCPAHKEALRALEVYMRLLKDGLIERTIVGAPPPAPTGGAA